MREAGTLRSGRIGILAGAAVLAAGPALAGAGGAGEPAQSEREAQAQVRALFDAGAGGSYFGVRVRDIEDGAGTGGVDEGAVVTETVEGGPASTAGVETGDVVVEFDGERIRGARQLTRVVRETPPGRTVRATVVRGGSRVTLNLTPGERPRPGWRVRTRRGEVPEADEPLVRFLGPDGLEGLRDVVDRAVWSFPAGRVRLGIRGESVDGQLADFFGVSAGVLVRHVDEDTAASDAGLRAGDVITAIDGESVDDLASLRRRLSALESDAPFTISIVRGRAETSLTAELGEEASPRPGGSRRGRGI